MYAVAFFIYLYPAPLTLYINILHRKHTCFVYCDPHLQLFSCFNRLIPICPCIHAGEDCCDRDHNNNENEEKKMPATDTVRTGISVSPGQEFIVVFSGRTGNGNIDRL